MDINENYIHVSEEEYKVAIDYLLSNRQKVPDKLSLLRKYKNASVKQNLDGNWRIFFGTKELIPKSEMEQLLTRMYEDPTTGGNVGRDRFYHRIHQQYLGISRRDVDRFIKNDEVHQIHLQITNKLHVVKPLGVPKGPNQVWQMDLIDMGEKKQFHNSGYRYCLTVIDIFSKHAWARPLKKKSSKEVLASLKDIVMTNNNTPPKAIQSDNGKEFANKHMFGYTNQEFRESKIKELQEKQSINGGLERKQELFLEELLSSTLNIHQVFGSPYRPQSQGCIERFNQTLKRMLYSHMTRYNVKQWIDVLPALMHNYNTILHGTTGTTPTELHFTKNESLITFVRKKILKRNQKWIQKSNEKSKQTIEVGDYVRLSNLVFKDFRKKGKLEKHGYTPNWSKDIWQVVDIQGENSDKMLEVYIVEKLEEKKEKKQMHVYRDNLQWIPSNNPRRTEYKRPMYDQSKQPEEDARNITINNYIIPPPNLQERKQRKRNPNKNYNEFIVDLPTPINPNLKSHNDDSDNGNVPQPKPQDTKKRKGIYNVEKILKRRKVKGRNKYMYLVRWEGYSSKDDSWIPRENFVNDVLIKNFLEKEKSK